MGFSRSNLHLVRMDFPFKPRLIGGLRISPNLVQSGSITSISKAGAPEASASAAEAAP